MISRPTIYNLKPLQLPPLSGAHTRFQAHCEANSHGKFYDPEIRGAIRGAFGRIRSNRSVSASNPRMPVADDPD